MADTHGYETIADRTLTAAETARGDELPTADATGEAVATRLARTVATRDDVAPADGTAPTWGDGNVAMTTAHTEVAATNRTKQDIKIELDTIVGSIADRTDGWGPDGGLDPQVDFDDDGLANPVDTDIDGDGDPNATDPDDYDPLVDSIP